MVPPSWAFDLVSADPALRSAALARHNELIKTWNESLARINRLWREKQVLRRAAEVRRAADAQQAAIGGTVYGAVADFERAARTGDPAAYRRLAPYAVLFLRWEAAYPVEWREAAPWSPWAVKKAVLRGFARRGPTDECEPDLVDLVLAAVGREQRCEDGWYAAVARAVDGPALRRKLRTAGRSADPVVRRRAGFVRWALDHPAAPVTLASWRAWLAGQEVTPA